MGYDKMFGFEKKRKTIADGSDVILSKDRVLDDSEKGYHYRWLVYVYNEDTKKYVLVFKNIRREVAREFFEDFM